MFIDYVVAARSSTEGPYPERIRLLLSCPDRRLVVLRGGTGCLDRLFALVAQ